MFHEFNIAMSKSNKEINKLLFESAKQRKNN